MANILRGLLVLVSAGCARKPGSAAALKPTGFGAAIVESSGGKQIGATGTVLAQPLVVQVNDEQGNCRHRSTGRVQWACGRQL